MILITAVLSAGIAGCGGEDEPQAAQASAGDFCEAVDHFSSVRDATQDVGTDTRSFAPTLVALDEAFSEVAALAPDAIQDPAAAVADAYADAILYVQNSPATRGTIERASRMIASETKASGAVQNYIGKNC